MCVLSGIERRFDPYREELGAQVAALRLIKVEMDIDRLLRQIECRIEKVLRGIRMGINDDGGIVDGFRLWCYAHLCDRHSRGEYE